MLFTIDNQFQVHIQRKWYGTHSQDLDQNRWRYRAYMLGVRRLWNEDGANENVSKVCFLNRHMTAPGVDLSWTTQCDYQMLCCMSWEEISILHHNLIHLNPGNPHADYSKLLDYKSYTCFIVFSSTYFVYLCYQSLVQSLVKLANSFLYVFHIPLAWATRMITFWTTWWWHLYLSM